jgi:hypothetical protein
MSIRNFIGSTQVSVFVRPQTIVVHCDVPPAAPKGFSVYEDRNDGYKMLYPFGWQEVAVTGADVVFKDIVEPLESVSVSLAKTDRASMAEFGDIATVSRLQVNNGLPTSVLVQGSAEGRAP